MATRAYCMLIGLLLFVPPAARASDRALTARELAPGIYALGSSHRFGSANVGWVIFEDHVTLIGAPHPDFVTECIAQIRKTTDKPIHGAILTHVGQGEKKAAQALLQQGIDVIAQSE